ncbi:hypothetical protein STANM309S_04563 [Streptomyces tanashiensis]
MPPQAAELALALAPQAEDPALIARMHRSVARTLLAEGRIAEADASLGKAAEMYRQLKIRTELANCRWMRGYVYAQNGDLARAEDELRAARAMLASHRAALYSSQVAVELADVLHRRGKSEEAADLLHGVLGGLSPERGAVHAAAAHRLLGIIAEDAPDTEAAEEHYVRALSLLERAGAAGDARRPVPAPRRPAAPHGPGGGRPRRVPHGPRTPHGRHHHPGPCARPATPVGRTPGTDTPACPGAGPGGMLSVTRPRKRSDGPRRSIGAPPATGGSRTHRTVPGRGGGHLPARRRRRGRGAPGHDAVRLPL